MYDTGSSLLVAQTRYRRERTNTQNRKNPHNGKNPSGSHDPKPVVPQTNYHTLTTMGFQLSLWLWFLLFRESSDVQKDVSIGGRGEVWIVKGKYELCGDEGKTRVWHVNVGDMRVARIYTIE